MTQASSNAATEKYFLKDDGIFPNNARLPVVVYRQILQLPLLFPAVAVKRMFEKNNWKNAWRAGIFEMHHYHSITHEVLGVYSGQTELLLGGENGIKITLKKGDVIIIPAGVAHKNLKKQNDIACIGAYPDGKDYDMNYGVKEERTKTDKNIKAVPLPKTDPVFGRSNGIAEKWS
jgi:uncharacterized protein YjlB